MVLARALRSEPGPPPTTAPELKSAVPEPAPLINTAPPAPAKPTAPKPGSVRKLRNKHNEDAPEGQFLWRWDGNFSVSSYESSNLISGISLGVQKQLSPSSRWSLAVQPRFIGAQTSSATNFSAQLHRFSGQYRVTPYPFPPFHEQLVQFHVRTV